MENTKLPAYPRTHEEMGSDEFNDNAGFTKLELASLMIAQGMASDDEWFAGKDPFSHIAKSSVQLAKVVLEEANK